MPAKKKKPAVDRFAKGFERACLLIYGSSIPWSRADLRCKNRVTRMLFGKKR